MKVRLDDDRNWNLDIFENYQHVENVCGNNPVCAFDSLTYSVMKQTKVTDFLYRLASRQGMIVRDGVDREIANFKITPVDLKEFLKENPVPFRHLSDHIQTIIDILF